MSPRRFPTVMGVISGVAVATLLAACSGASVPAASSPAAPSTATSGPPTSTPTDPSSPTPASNASALSGRPDGAGLPILAVKIDNTRAAQPHAGLSAADLVYVEEVEWGLTRLIALFSTDIPDIIGPIRSARVSDIDILAPFGAIPFVYSGAQSKLLPSLAAAEFLDASASASYRGWFNDPARPAPTDHMIRAADVMAVFDETASVDDIGLTFSAQPPRGGEPVSEITAQWGASSVGFRWDPDSGDYVVVIDGADSRSSEGGPQRAATVVIQSVVQSDSGYGDKFGGVTPSIDTLGSGTALVLRDGLMWEVTWERASLEEGTRFVLPDGSSMPFAVGQEWIVLLDADRTPIVR